VGRLTGIDTMLLDLDGTLYVGSQVVPGTPEAVRWLRAQGLTVCWPAAGPGRASGPPVWSPIPSYRATYDELAADIGGGHAVAAATVLVRSGKGGRPSQAPEAEPDAKVDSIADLPGLLQG
jgi:ribonucleotide monophosphatase NagD (HAD superfamily)